MARVLVPSWKVTAPVGGGPTGAEGALLTDAVYRAGCPNTVGLGSAVSAVRVGTVTSCWMMLENAVV